MNAIAPHPAETAPTDGRLIRGYFIHALEAGADFHAVLWDQAAGGWVNLLGEPVRAHLTLTAWGEG